MKKNLLRVGAFLAICAAGFVSAGIAIGSGGPPVMVTICHAAGQAGTTKFVTLTLPENAVYGQAGHFNENGTPRAGHEQDYLGACEGDETTPTETIPTEPTVTVPTEPTVTEPEGTTPEQPPFKCPNGEEPNHGLDGNPGNDSCDPCAEPVSLEKCPPPATPTPEVVPPVEEVTPPSVVTPPMVTKPKPTKPKQAAKPKIVSVKPGKKPDTVIIKTSDGKTHIGIKGSG